MTPSWKLSHALRVVGRTRRCAQLAEQDREHEALTVWHVLEGGP